MTRDLVAFLQEGHMWAPQDQYSGGGQGSDTEDDRMRNIKRCSFYFFLNSPGIYGRVEMWRISPGLILLLLISKAFTLNFI